MRTDGLATRKRILGAAMELIANSGFAETTNKSIAAKAGVDLASLNYHFGSRGGLYQATLGEAHRRLVSLDELQRIATAGVPPREKLRALLEMLLARRTGPEARYALVMAREMQSPSSHLRTLAREEIMPKLGVVLSILEEITGIPAGDPSLLRCLVSVAAPCLMLFLGRNVTPLANVFASTHEDLTSHLYIFAIAGLDAIGAEYERRQAGSASREPRSRRPPKGPAGSRAAKTSTRTKARRTR
ncbi:MAG TPA: CerR family C-terminal domain-containing protein [Kofleriaceae bacterium]|jgi:AcrR family transcriptional regulator